MEVQHGRVVTKGLEGGRIVTKGLRGEGRTLPLKYKEIDRLHKFLCSVKQQSDNN